MYTKLNKDLYIYLSLFVFFLNNEHSHSINWR